MNSLTKLSITLELEDGEDVHEIVSSLPKYCASSFERVDGVFWRGDFIVSCPVAPELAEGDFVDDLSPHFPALLRLKQFHRAEFEMRIAVGNPGPAEFVLESHSVALLAALGASIKAVRSESEPSVGTNGQ